MSCTKQVSDCEPDLCTAYLTAQLVDIVWSGLL